VSAQHGDLVPEHQDLDVLRRVGSGEQRQPAQHAGERQVGESKCHGERSCWAASEQCLQGRPAAKPLIRGHDTVLGTHRHLRRVLAEYAAHYNTQRQHQALQVRPPRPQSPVPEPVYGKIRRRPILGGLTNEYEPAA
jgi:hypothetical protein